MNSEQWIAESLENTLWSQHLVLIMKQKQWTIREPHTLPHFNLSSTFFGFNAKDQVFFHNQLFDLLWAGEGRWSFEDIYTMPLRIRKLWVSRINKLRSDAASDREDQANQNKNKISRPQFKK